MESIFLNYFLCFFLNPIVNVTSFEIITVDSKLDSWYLKTHTNYVYHEFWLLKNQIEFEKLKINPFQCNFSFKLLADLSTVQCFHNFVWHRVQVPVIKICFYFTLRLCSCKRKHKQTWLLLMPVDCLYQTNRIAMWEYVVCNVQNSTTIRW